MTETDWTLPVQILAASLMAGFLIMALACKWAERRLDKRRTPRPNRAGINLNAELK